MNLVSVIPVVASHPKRDQQHTRDCACSGERDSQVSQETAHHRNKLVPITRAWRLIRQGIQAAAANVANDATRTHVGMTTNVLSVPIPSHRNPSIESGPF